MINAVLMCLDLYMQSMGGARKLRSKFSFFNVFFSIFPVGIRESICSDFLLIPMLNKIPGEFVCFTSNRRQKALCISCAAECNFLWRHVCDQDPSGHVNLGRQLIYQRAFMLSSLSMQINIALFSCYGTTRHVFPYFDAQLHERRLQTAVHISYLDTTFSVVSNVFCDQ